MRDGLKMKHPPPAIVNCQTAQCERVTPPASPRRIADSQIRFFECLLLSGLDSAIYGEEGREAEWTKRAES
jgi:hypothetical protein